VNIIRAIFGWVMPLVILGLAVFGFVTLGKQPPPQRRAAEGVTTAAVETVPVATEGDGMTLDLDGVVVPLREVLLAAEVGGRVVHKAGVCRGGQFVEKGTLLLAIDPRDYELEVRRLEQEFKQAELTIAEVDEEIVQNAASVELARRQVELAHREVVRLDGLKATRVVTEADYERALRDELAAENSRTTLEGQRRVLAKRRIRLQEARTLAATLLERARLDLERTRVVAPASGIVVEDMVEQDSFVSKGTVLVKLEDTSAVEVRASLQMDELARLWSGRRNGQRPAAGPYDFPETPVSVVYRIGESTYRWRGTLMRQEGRGLDDRTRTLPCRVLVTDPEGVEAIDRYGAVMPELPPEAPRSLLRGMFVDVLVHVETDGPLVSIPEEARRPNGEVWVVREGRLIVLSPRPQQVASGRVFFAAEAAGLSPGDRVVVSQLSGVRPGMAVADSSPERQPVKTAAAVPVEGEAARREISSAAGADATSP
jgi:multidrug efflux pump subunit AcrA (membrane-fusion protein)